jgi:two-component system, chemotaxis family, CheB/CheR fusion protein
MARRRRSTGSRRADVRRTLPSAARPDPPARAEASRTPSSAATPHSPERVEAPRTSISGPTPDRPGPSSPAERSGFLVVGIGASAGGLEALEQFFSAVPANSGLAFIVVSHQRPGGTSLLPQLLGKRAAIPVVESTNGIRVEPNRLYLAPPGSHMALRDGKLVIPEATGSEPRVALPIDYFFRSLAEDRGPDAVGIVLSGAGGDGTLGLKAIKGHAGMTLAQDATSARYTSMPQSAFAAGAVDYVRRPQEMADVLLAYARRARQAPTENTQAWHRIILLLQDRSGVDFGAYKLGTAQRRLERRMHVNQIASVGDYLRYLQANSHELDALFSELLIGVTSFFRDPLAFEALAQALPAMLDDRADGSPVRVWVPGCSTGEEAYGIGILLREYMAARRAPLNVQIFGTDVDPRAIETARTGFYPSGIVNDVAPARLERFFVKEDNGYRVRKELRDLVVFATHNVLGDPPFSKLDVLSCRNLLIYLESAAQQRLLRLFHHALNSGGLLFLGPSESVEEARELYTVLDRKCKLFRRADVSAPPLEALPWGGARVTPREMPVPLPPGEERRPSIVGLLQALLLDQYAPPSVVIDSRGEIVFIHGRTGLFLEPAPGRPTNVLVEMARPGLRAALAAVLREAALTRKEVVRRAARVRTNGDTTRVDVRVRPISEPEVLRRLWLVTFVAAGHESRSRDRRRVPGTPRGKDSTELVEELSYTKERLQHSLEELQAANEELMSSNEELTSTNEELQSANEELETTKEEMQSLNEELVTVNAELRAKLDDLAEAHADLQNLLNSTDIATVFLDTDLRIKRFTPQAHEVFHMIPSDVGRPLADLVPTLAYERLMEDARDVLRTLTPCERVVQSASDAWYTMRILPYRTTKDAIGGLVLTFVDVTRTKQAESVLTRARNYFESIVETVRGPLLVLDADLRIVSANRAFYRTFDLLPADVQGHVLWDVAGGAWSTPELHEQVERVRRTHESFEGVETEAVFPRVGRKRVVVNGRRLEQQIGLPGSILLVMEERPGAG